MLKAHRLIILLAFTASGCAGLIYESVWSHYLGLYLGHAAYAQTLTLAIFMGGMTLGAYVTSRYIDKIRNALMGYAIAELILGVAGLAFHFIYTAFIDFSYDTVFPGLGSIGLINFYKWTSGALLILPQSIILGSTFPLLCSALIRREQEGIGKHISVLYFSNSIGAAAGALIATFMLIPAIGMPGAMLTSGIINIAIAVITYSVSKHPEQSSRLDESDELSRDAKTTIVVLVAAALTGAVSFMYEIAWIRMLNLVLGTSLHAFEIMLSAFIAGLALGGWWIRNRIEKIPDLLRFTGQVQIFMGLAAISTLTLYAESFGWVATLLNETIQKTDTGYVFYNLATSLISGLIMIPATFCAGMTLPLLTTHLLRKQHNESAIGRVYASNTIGAICGIVFAVHIGMTQLGLKWLIVFAGIIDIGLGIYLIFYMGRSLKWISLPSRLAATGLVVLATLGLITELDPSRLSSGSFRYARTETPGEILFYKDGKTASISVEKVAEFGANISTNGKPDASLRTNLNSGDEQSAVTRNLWSDEVTMTMLGSIAYLVNPDIRDVANIGFGSGLTSHVLLSNPSLASLDTIEIEPVMVEGARLFMSRNALAYEDPRSNIRIEDAKTFFAAHQKKYDAIISEPSNPWVAGVGNLFTVEFYEHMKNHLTDEGLMVQWLHLYEISLPTLLTALSSLNHTFPNYELYTSVPGDILIVASPDAGKDLSIKPTWEQIPSALKSELEIVGLDSIWSISSRNLITRKEIDALIKASDASQNSDYFPLLSLNAPRDRFKGSDGIDIFALQLLGIFDSPYRNRSLSGSSIKPDAAHLYQVEMQLTQKIENLLQDISTVEDIDYTMLGVLQTLRHPEAFCASTQSRTNWIQALYRVAMLANNFGTRSLREQLLHYSSRFLCVDQLEAKPAALLEATKISLDDFSNSSRDQLRAIMTGLEGMSMNPTLLSFIESCYLLSLIDNPAAVEEKDLEVIARNSGQFDQTNLWLESLLIGELHPL
jgi:spermidine synthase